MYVQTFRCPNCNQVLTTDVDKCRFCLSPLNQDDVQKGDLLQTNIAAAKSLSDLVNVLGNALLYLFGSVAFVFALLTFLVSFGWMFLPRTLKPIVLLWVLLVSSWKLIAAFLLAAYLTVFALSVYWWSKFRDAQSKEALEARKVLRGLVIIGVAILTGIVYIAAFLYK